MITSVPVGGVSGRLFAMVLDSQDFGYPPIFRDALSVGGLQASVPEIWHFQIGEKCKQETRGQVWRVQRARIMPDGSRFQGLGLGLGLWG